MLTSSLGCTSFLPASALARFAITSLAFMLDWVPEPVCQTTRGKWAFSAPEMTSPAACSMAPSFSAVIFSGFRAWLALAAASLRIPKACMISAGMVSSPTPMGKFSWLRWVWAPQYLSAGTRTSPIESCSIRYSIFFSFLLVRPHAVGQNVRNCNCFHYKQRSGRCQSAKPGAQVPAGSHSGNFT